MKTCPNCKTIMKESDEPTQIAPLPQQPLDGPPIKGVGRVRYHCPECHHVEAGFPAPKR
jgi:hypothetical protein